MNIGIDLGGSHIGMGLITDDGKITRQDEVYITEAVKSDIQKFIDDNIVRMLKDWKNDGINPEKIGIGVPGVVSGNTIKYCVNLGIYNYDLEDTVKQVFPDAKVLIKNDAKWAALAEKKIGSLKDFKDCIYVGLGTGIGGAYFYNNELVSPTRSSGFEFGHTIIKENGELCKCGNKGCFEKYCSMKTLKLKIKKCLNLDSSVDGEQLRQYIREHIGNPELNVIFDEFVSNLCLGLANIVNILEPQAICIGGGFVQYKDILFDRFEKAFNESSLLFYKENKPKLVLAELGNNAGMIGSTLW